MNGALMYVLDGVATDAGLKPVSKDSKDMKAVCNLVRMGASHYVTFADQKELAKFGEGEPVRLCGNLRVFKDTMYLGNATVVATGKAVSEQPISAALLQKWSGGK